MTIDQAIKDICEKHFPQFSYIFDDEFNIDQAVSREKLPAIAHVLPVGGTMVMRNGRIYDRENIYNLDMANLVLNLFINKSL